MDILPFSFLTVFQNCLIFCLFCSFLKDRQGRRRTANNWLYVTPQKTPLGSNLRCNLAPLKPLANDFELWYNDFGTILRSAKQISDRTSLPPCKSRAFFSEGAIKRSRVRWNLRKLGIVRDRASLLYSWLEISLCESTQYVCVRMRNFPLPMRNYSASFPFQNSEKHKSENTN